MGTRRKIHIKRRMPSKSVAKRVAIQSGEQDAETKTQRLERENTTLRAIAAKVMPCHYCGADNIGKCPHGFPGCSLADDMACYDELGNMRLCETQNALIDLITNVELHGPIDELTEESLKRARLMVPDSK